MSALVLIRATITPAFAVFCLQHAVFFLKVMAAFVIPDQTASTRTQLARQEYLVNKHFKFIKDEVPNVLVRSSDDDAEIPDGMGSGGGQFDVAPNEELARRNAAYLDMKMLTQSAHSHVASKKEKAEKARAQLAGDDAHV